MFSLKNSYIIWNKTVWIHLKVHFGHRFKVVSWPYGNLGRDIWKSKWTDFISLLSLKDFLYPYTWFTKCKLLSPFPSHSLSTVSTKFPLDLLKHMVGGGTKWGERRDRRSFASAFQVSEELLPRIFSSRKNSSYICVHNIEKIFSSWRVGEYRTCKEERNVTFEQILLSLITKLEFGA